MKEKLHKIIVILGLIVLIATSYSSSAQIRSNKVVSPIIVEDTDFDPFVNLLITVEIKSIRALDTIDRFSDPDFYVKVFINNQEFTSDTWRNTKYVTDPHWSATGDVPDEEEYIPITIQLWDQNIGRDTHCDIADNNQTEDAKDINVFYDLKTGYWDGNDYREDEPIWADPSGYGRANGCDDGSIYTEDNDCELLFDIYQNDVDGDSIPTWTETNIYNTNPQVNDHGRDDDHDGVPIEWEWKWGLFPAWDGYEILYDPFEWNNFTAMDPDKEGLDNYEEHLTSQWGSDPFRRDFFLELDQMEIGPNGEGHFVPELTKNLWRDVFAKHNIVFHLDDGSLGGGDILPFSTNITQEDLTAIYYTKFLNQNLKNWRQGVFHYGLVIYHSGIYPGFVWNGGYGPYLDSFQFATDHHDAIAENKLIKLYKYNQAFFMFLRYKTFNVEYKRAIIYAGAMMHETGHTLGIFSGNTPGCDDQNGKYPWEKNFWKWGPYKSCMNYRYAYSMVDYSDGSHSDTRDWDDWSRIDLQFFQRELY